MIASCVLNIVLTTSPSLAKTGEKIDSLVKYVGKM